MVFLAFCKFQVGGVHPLAPSDCGPGLAHTTNSAKRSDYQFWTYKLMCL